MKTTCRLLAMLTILPFTSFTWKLLKLKEFIDICIWFILKWNVPDLVHVDVTLCKSLSLTTFTPSKIIFIAFLFTRILLILFQCSEKFSFMPCPKTKVSTVQNYGYRSGMSGSKLLIRTHHGPKPLNQLPRRTKKCQNTYYLSGQFFVILQTSIRWGDQSWLRPQSPLTLQNTRVTLTFMTFQKILFIKDGKKLRLPGLKGTKWNVDFILHGGVQVYS